jgi:hypothetical protein
MLLEVGRRTDSIRSGAAHKEAISRMIGGLDEKRPDAEALTSN